MERAGRVELRDLQLGKLLRAPCASRPALWRRVRESNPYLRSEGPVV